MKEYQPRENLLLVPGEVAVRMVLVGVCLVLAWMSGLPLVQLGLRLPDWYQVGVGVLVGVGLQAVIYLSGQWLIRTFGDDLYSPVIMQNITPRNLRQWLPVSLAFIPPIVMEELLFRTLWLGLFSPPIPVGVVIVGSSVMFAFMHLPQGILGVVGAGLINIALGVVFVWQGDTCAGTQCKSVMVTIVAHYVINMLQLVMAYRSQDWLTEA